MIWGIVFGGVLVVAGLLGAGWIFVAGATRRRSPVAYHPIGPEYERRQEGGEP